MIPEAYLDEVASAGPEQEKLELWIMQQVKSGAELPGLYPVNKANLARYRGETGG